MDYYYSFILYSLPLVLSLVLLKLLSLFKTKSVVAPLLPPSPPSLPIIGHLLHFKKPLHRSLAALSSLHSSPILLLRFGSRPVLLVSSLPLADECFTTNDLIFATRPQLPSTKSLSYNYTTLSSAPYGPHWRNTRRMATVELLSSARLNSLSEVRLQEVKSLLRSMFELTPSKHDKFREIELEPRLSAVALNVMTRTIAGRRNCEEEETRFREMLEDALKMAGVSNLSDFLPVLRLVDFGQMRRTKRVNEKKELMLQGLIDEMRKRREQEKSIVTDEEKKKQKKTMLEVLLDLQEESPEYYTDLNIKAMIVTLFFAGTDTSTGTLVWAMTLLLNHPHRLQKLRNEIDSFIENSGDHRLLQEQEVSNLPYLQAIINETLRLFPAAPLLLPHQAIEECTVGGYRVPRGTMLIVNAWAIHRDPALWSDPLEFKPERFMEGGGGRIIPFGLGRRRCPGDGLAIRMIGLVLGTLIQCFEWERIGKELIDTEELGGLTLHKLHPLRVLYRPREIMVDVLSKI